MLNKEKHKGILIRVLKDIYTDNTLGPALGFKGGTAAMLFYNLDRFSVDLDFDLLDVAREDEVFEKVGEIVGRYGTIKDQRKKHFTLFYRTSRERPVLCTGLNRLTEKCAAGGRSLPAKKPRCRPRTPCALAQGSTGGLFYEMSYSAVDRNVKVEISRRNFSSKYEAMNYFGILMNVMVKEDMFANKLTALYERVERANRDIFDVWFFLQNNWPIDKALAEKRTGISFKELVAACIEKLEKVPDRSILSGMGELLDDKQKSWTKAKLKAETLFLLRVMLDNET